MGTFEQNWKQTGMRTEWGDPEKTDRFFPPDMRTEVSTQEKSALSRIAPEKADRGKRQIGATVHKFRLVNQINAVHFKDRNLLVHFSHPQYDRAILLNAKPQPCTGDFLDCLWAETRGIGRIINSYQFENLFLPDGKKLILVEPEVTRIDKAGIRFLLPESGFEVGSRSLMRYSCTGITARMIQNSSIFSGSLVEFNARFLKVELRSVPPQTFEWINPDSPVNLILSDANETYYAGECEIIRHTIDRGTGTYVLKPLSQEIQRFSHREFRSCRYELTPLPHIMINHPFIKKQFDLKVLDLSGSGFSVAEDENHAVLLPGMILPDAVLRFADGLTIKFRAQVVYRKPLVRENDRQLIKCGLALLDIAGQDHVRLCALLHQAHDGQSYICNTVDLDALWDFFFDTGFIYPDKYVHIQKNKDRIKRTYEKLYTQHPHIARHFICQVNGRLMGHMAMIRFYENTWLIHHHAARKSALNKAGLMVLDQAARFIYDAYRLSAMHMNYLICYYRPDNKFPSRVFGGVARYIDNPRKCSLDTFVYFHCPVVSESESGLPEGWRLTETRNEDLMELKLFYEQSSGGLMLSALDLKPDARYRNGISREYRKLGFRRERHFYSLKRNDTLKAVIIITISDIGLNLSDLTNCITVFVLDPKNLSKETLFPALSLLIKKTGRKQMPVLLHPVSFAKDQSISHDKVYHLWALDPHGQSDKFFKYLNRLLRLG